MNSRMSRFLLFLRDMLIIFGVVIAVAVTVFLILQSPRQTSNIFFISGVICWIIAAFPAFTEIGGNARISIQNRKDSEKAQELIRGREEKYRSSARGMYLYGISGFFLIVLSIFTLPISV